MVAQCACKAPNLRLVSRARRALREEMYRAFVTRASSGAGDNTPLIERTLALRAEQARLLGYPNYAEVSLARKVCLHACTRSPALLRCLFSAHAQST